MHLCGNLSERAIEFFRKIPSIQAIVLSPCCLPKMRKGKEMFDTSNLDDGDSYMKWSNHLKVMIEKSLPDSTIPVKTYRDNEMHSTKNSIITTIRP